MRDRALLAFGMAGALRRSEVVAPHLADVEWVEEGLRVTIRRSKTDQDGVGATVAIPEGRRLRHAAAVAPGVPSSAGRRGDVRACSAA